MDKGINKQNILTLIRIGAILINSGLHLPASAQAEVTTEAFSSEIERVLPVEKP